MQAKKLTQRSGWDVILTMLAAWLATNLPLWVDMIDLSAPWDKIVPQAAAFVAALLRLFWVQGHDPSVPVTALPMTLRVEVERKHRPPPAD